LRYLITFACYGSHLHGQEGAVDSTHNTFGAPLADVDPDRAASEVDRMDQLPYLLDGERREVVLRAVRMVCSHRRWNLWAAHVRSNHVHVVIEAEVKPEKCLNDFKAYASRALNQAGLDGAGRKRWAHHGSTRWLWKDGDVQEAVRYVVFGQGEPMAVYLGDLL
jgi:REP element-mobilizing transposase RayT